jgi:electron transfer flavoprotein alpha/beta subunit
MWNPFRHRRRRATDLILERLALMSTDITALQTVITGLETIVASVPLVLQANADLNTRVITVLEGFLAATGNTVNQSDIDALTARVQTTLGSLQADAQNVAAQNAALQAELDKIAGTAQPAPTTPAAPSV